MNVAVLAHPKEHAIVTLGATNSTFRRRGRLEKAEPATSTGELERRIAIASTQATTYFQTWAGAEKRAALEWERLNPESAALKKCENDWSNV